MTMNEKPKPSENIVVGEKQQDQYMLADQLHGLDQQIENEKARMRLQLEEVATLQQRLLTEEDVSTRKRAEESLEVATSEIIKHFKQREAYLEAEIAKVSAQLRKTAS